MRISNTVEKKKKFIKGEVAEKLIKSKGKPKKNRTGKEIRKAMYKEKEA